MQDLDSRCCPQGLTITALSFVTSITKNIGTINCFHLILTKFSKIFPTYKGFDRKQANQTFFYYLNGPQAKGPHLVLPMSA